MSEYKYMLEDYLVMLARLLEGNNISVPEEIQRIVLQIIKKNERGYHVIDRGNSKRN